MNPDEPPPEPPPQQPAAPQPIAPPPMPRPHVPPRAQSASAPAPEIPMPGESRVGGVRARVGRKNIDLDLHRIKRRKRFGYIITALSVLFVAFIVAPVTWVAVYAFVDPPTNILMMRRAGEGETIRHQPVPLAQVSPHVVRAVIAAEDNNFCAHSGFDWEAIQDAWESNALGGPTRGGSTISQQVAKNLFLWPDQTLVRKGLEFYFTVLIEAMWPKRRIMEAYLNIAEWGDGNFGIEAAAQARFGVPASRLSQLQAARLAAVLPSPNSWRADRPGPYVQQRSAMLVARARTVKNEHLAGCVLLLDSVRRRK
ncbi:MAG: monofunctional biosynthetic peptidoglycan transglycosylase [Terricaulis sp.]